MIANRETVNNVYEYDVDTIGINKRLGKMLVKCVS